MKEIQTIKLEGNEYMVVGELTIDGIDYIHFARTNNPKDFCIRKVKVIDGEEMIVGLDSREEFDAALKAFSKKHLEEL